MVLTKKQELPNQSSALSTAPDTTAFSTSLGSSFPALCGCGLPPQLNSGFFHHQSSTAPAWIGSLTERPHSAEATPRPLKPGGLAGGHLSGAMVPCSASSLKASAALSGRLMMSQTLPSAELVLKQPNFSSSFLKGGCLSATDGTGCAKISIQTRGPCFLPWAMIQSQHPWRAPLQTPVGLTVAAGLSHPAVIPGT